MGDVSSIPVVFEITWVGQFMRLNPPNFIGTEVDEDPYEFIDKIDKILRVMHACFTESVEYITYRLKDLFNQGYEKWE